MCVATSPAISLRLTMSTTDLPGLERRLWAAADQLRANSSQTLAEYRGPALGRIFLAFAKHRFEERRPGCGGQDAVRA
jgi:type I restriction enzyme M protein